MLLSVENSTYKINKWKKESCTEHNLEAEGNCKKKEDCIEWKLPFDLHTFPGPIKCKQLREAWIKALRQEPFDKKGSWLPAPSDQVCSIHFADELATDENPIPTLFLSYENKEKKSK